jgi:hypothetical protein
VQEEAEMKYVMCQEVRQELQRLHRVCEGEMCNETQDPIETLWFVWQALEMTMERLGIIPPSTEPPRA